MEKPTTVDFETGIDFVQMREEMIASKRARQARRIASRISKFMESDNVTHEPYTVKGGPLGIFRTNHDAETYKEVEAILSNDVEVKIAAFDLPSVYGRPIQDYVEIISVGDEDYSHLLTDREQRATQIYPPAAAEAPEA